MNRKRVGIAVGVTALVLAAGVLGFHPSRPLYMSHRPVEIVAPDGVRLAGTLSRPRWRSEPVPAVVIVHGSGPLTREHMRMDARRFAWEGVAVLAYDKRGVGESQGVYHQGWGDEAEATLRRLAGDAAAALQALRREPGIDATRVGFFGASQAGWIIPLASAQLDPPPRFNLLLSAPAISTGVEELYSQFTGDGHRTPGLTDAAEIRARVEAFDGPAGYDPAEVLRATRVPTLWLLGEADESVPTYASVRVLDAIRASGNAAHTLIVYPGANHGLHDPVSGQSAPLWTDIFAWLARNGVLPADA